MKINQFLSAILLLVAVFFMGSCENYSEEVLNGTVQMNSPLLNEEAGEAAVFHVRNTDVGETTYTFEIEVDLSTYPEGTCFALFGMARGTKETDGYDSQGIYFCKKNDSE